MPRRGRGFDCTMDEVVDVPEHHRYELRVDGEVAGMVVYELDGSVINLVHTEIEPAFEGQGMGGRIASGVLDDVRRRGLQVVASCPFLGSWIERHPDYGDLLV